MTRENSTSADDGRWKVVHEHVSMPFDMETGKAMLDLKP